MLGLKLIHASKRGPSAYALELHLLYFKPVILPASLDTSSFFTCLIYKIKYFSKQIKWNLDENFAKIF